MHRYRLCLCMLNDWNHRRHFMHNVCLYPYSRGKKWLEWPPHPSHSRHVCCLKPPICGNELNDVNGMDLEREICGKWWAFFASTEESFDVFDKVIIKVTRYKWTWFGEHVSLNCTCIVNRIENRTAKCWSLVLKYCWCIIKLEKSV